MCFMLNLISCVCSKNECEDRKNDVTSHKNDEDLINPLLQSETHRDSSHTLGLVTVVSDHRHEDIHVE